MIRLDRTGVKVPATWAKRVERAFADAGAFQAKARGFEELDIDDPTRREGFRSFGADVLPRIRGKSDFRALWGSAKTALRKMSHQKCSYCESMVPHARTGSVEHFKPKSLFPSLAYDWDNYFLGCGGEVLSNVVYEAGVRRRPSSSHRQT